MTNSNAAYFADIVCDLPDYPAAVITFRNAGGYFVSGNAEVFPGQTYTLTLSATGQGTQRLPCPDNTGVTAVRWNIGLPDGDIASVSIAYSATSQNLSDVLASTATTTTPDAVTAALANKMDKDTDAVAGNVAIFDANGQAIDANFAMSWNDTDKTVNIPLTDDVTLQVGQEVVVYARNNTGATITNGSIVRLSGAIADKPTIALAQADTTANARQIGMVTEDIVNNGFGFVTLAGFVRGIDTSGWSEGDVLYLSPDTAGLKINVLPVFPEILVEVGLVVRSHPTAGIVFVHAYETESGSYVKAAAAASSVAGDLTTHAGLSTTAHGGILPEDAGIVAVSASRDLAASDAGKILECSGVLTLNAPDGLDSGFQCVLARIAAGAVTITATTTLYKLTADTGLEAVASVAIDTAVTLYHRGSNQFVVFGDYT